MEYILSYIDKLKKYGKKRITKEDLHCLFGLPLDEQLYPVIQTLEKENVIQPVTSSLTNGNRVFPLYTKYKIQLPDDSYAAELAEISHLHPLLQKTGYLQANPVSYRKYRTQLQRLDQYLFACGLPQTPVSRKERSFEIFSEEKELDAKSFCTFLAKLDLNSENLSFYDTPEYCFNDYIPERKPHMVLLICENKDIWFNLRRMMFENNAYILWETKIDGVLYGCGNKICQAGALEAYTHFMGGSCVDYLYWGDIDREGFDIYLRLRDAAPHLNIQLFQPAYEAMLKLSAGRIIPVSSDSREHGSDYSAIFEMFSAECRVLLENSLAKNHRLPQEIITYTYLKANMR